MTGRNGSGPAHAPFPLTDLQSAYLVGATPLMELGGFRPNFYREFDLVHFDPARAEDAINRLILRHEHLRTAVLPDGTQRVLGDEEAAPFRLLQVDLVGLDRDLQENAIRRARERMCDRGPAPTGWPLFEIVAHRVRPHRTRLHIAMSLLLLDSGSTFRLQDEWWRLYRDPEAELPPVPRTFRECVLSRAAEEGTETYREHWRYWEARLDSLPGPPRLPLARRPGDIDPVRMVRRTCRLTRTQWERLRANFRTHRVLPSTALLHVFAETLGAWAAEPRFSVNVLHQNWSASRPETAGVVGHFSATLPVEVDGRRSGGDFWERARRLQRRLWQDLKHADVTGVRITRELATRRGWTSQAAFPYVFNSMLGPGDEGATTRRPVGRMVTSNLRTPQVLIDNQALDGPDGGVTCVWDVVDDAFPPGLPDLMFEAYHDMVRSLARPEGSGLRPDPLPARHRALVAAGTGGDSPPEGRLQDGFLRRAAAHPDAPAVVTPRRTMSYGEAEALSRAVAGWLRDQGLGRGDVVPVVMAKGWEQVVAVLGVLRAGAAYCPVDADLPAERTGRLLEACAARAVLGQSHRSPELGAGPSLATLYVDRMAAAANTSPVPEPEPEGAPDDLAYVIHTSGSTGRPKGVMIEHRAALNTIVEINRRVGLAPEDRVFGISSLSFDLSVWDVFGTLAAGAAIVLPDATSRPDPLGWAEAAVRHSATVWNSVPALAEMLVETVEQRPELGRPPVRVFLLSGDWIPTSLPDRVRRSWPGTRVIALGGATEASIWSNIQEVDHVDPDWRSIPYGRPLRNQTMWVLDDGLDVRAPWATGRIHIGGAGLARGYQNDAERTAERFVRNPRTGERLYWTGDLGRYWPDGTIEFLGREDRQLKIQGFRIEPSEVESAIRGHPGVRDCAVAGEDLRGGRRRLVAFVVPRPGRSVDARTVTNALRSTLPHYMVPGRIHVVERLPLTANGKVDVTRALADLADDAAAATGAAVETDSAGDVDHRSVKRLSELWTELLNVPAVGPDSDFFALGGNSLLALRLVNRVRAELGTDLAFGQIFERPTVRGLAACIAEGGHRTNHAVTLSGGDGRELFLLHPVGGSVACYVDLARAWPGPVHAFQSRALVDATDESFAPDLETMAATYREELQRSSPDGPYVLGGWSMGGVLAHEVARQLAGLGHRSSVFMIDSVPRGTRLPDTEVERHLEFLADLARGRLPSSIGESLRKAPPGALAASARDAAVAHGLLPAGTDVPGYERLVRVHAHNLAILAAHHPARSGVPTLLFLAGAVERPDPLPAWRAICPGIEVEIWPLDHYSIVGGDRLPAIAERVTAWLPESG